MKEAVRVIRKPYKTLTSHQEFRKCIAVKVIDLRGNEVVRMAPLEKQVISRR